MNKLPPYILLPLLTSMSLAIGYMANRVTAGMTFEDPIIADVVKVFQLHITDLAIALIVLKLAKESKPSAGSRKK